MEQKTAAVLLIFSIIIIILKIHSLFTNFTALRIIQQLKVTVFTAYWQCDMKDLRIFVFFFFCIFSSTVSAVWLKV